MVLINKCWGRERKVTEEQLLGGGGNLRAHLVERSFSLASLAPSSVKLGDIGVDGLSSLCVFFLPLPNPARREDKEEEEGGKTLARGGSEGKKGEGRKRHQKCGTNRQMRRQQN